MTIEEVASTGLRGKALADAVSTDLLGVSPTKPAAERTPEGNAARL